jgi:hypothetical protein
MSTAEPMKRKPFLLRVLLAVLPFVATWLVYSIGTDRGRFEGLLRRVASDPSRCIGDQISIDTFDSLGVSSAYIGDAVDSGHELLERRLGKAGRTFYSDMVDMPTQETIWQFSSFFVRLYVTSALECDAAAVGVIGGRYEDYRKEHLSAEVDPSARLSPIEYASPKRFLYPDR